MESFRKVVIDSRWSYSLRWASSTRSSLAIARRTPSEGNRRPNSMSERKGADLPTRLASWRSDRFRSSRQLPDPFPEGRTVHVGILPVLVEGELFLPS